MIYLDHAATTPVPRPVADAMYQVLTEQFGNPSSQYPLGREAKALVEEGRAVVAGDLGCRPENLHFTSCGRTTGPSPPPCGRAATPGGTSSPPPWSTAPCWSRVSCCSSRDTR